MTPFKCPLFLLVVILMCSVEETLHVLYAAFQAGLYNGEYAIITIDFDQAEAEELSHDEMKYWVITNGLINIRAESSIETNSKTYNEYLKEIKAIFLKHFGFETPYPNEVCI